MLTANILITEYVNVTHIYINKIWIQNTVLWNATCKYSPQ